MFIAGTDQDQEGPLRRKRPGRPADQDTAQVFGQRRPLTDRKDTSFRPRMIDDCSDVPGREDIRMRG